MEQQNVTTVLNSNNNLSLFEYLSINGFDASKFNIPLEFWFNLNSMFDNEWFTLSEELISLIGFKSCESNPSVGKSNLVKFIRKNFEEGVEYMTNLEKIVKVGRGGAQHKIEIKMRKRPFKKMLLKVGTSTSDIIHEYLLDLEDGCMKYALYQEKCKFEMIIQENKELKNAKFIAQSNSQILLTAEACPRTTICHNPKGFPISSMKCAIYVLKLPLLNMFKFGFSNNLINRLKQHEHDFGEISIELAIEAPDVQEIEKRLKTEMRSHGINTVYEIDGRKLKELFDPKHLEHVNEIIQNVLINYETCVFTNLQNQDYRMICEQTKQHEYIFRQKQCDIEILSLRIKLYELDGKRKFDEM